MPPAARSMCPEVGRCGFPQRRKARRSRAMARCSEPPMDCRPRDPWPHERDEMSTAPTADAVVLVGGQGTRLRPLTLTTPKPMLPTAGVPFLEHLLSRICLLY